MANIELWKLAIDAGLLLSCIFFLIGLMRSSKPAYSTNHLSELNNKLQTVIREADETGKTLNQQLMRRQEQLEKILFEVETIEHRINRLLATSEEKRGTLDIELGKAKQIISQLIDEMQRTQELHKEVAKDRELLKVLVELPKDDALHSAISREEAQPRDQDSLRATREADTDSLVEEPAADWSAVNIFGEKVNAQDLTDPRPLINQSKVVENYIPLTSSIEKKVSPEPRPESALDQLTEVYNAAENLLRAGRGPEQVSNETNLPIEEVRVLKRIVDQDKEMQSSSSGEKSDQDSIIAADERLGVLGSLRKHVPFF